ncbi:DUF302 domain-containing protein [Zoogloea sp.]|uniref:DUF302 domain-containing protein n=1 Tax=Zoogloea sp. TaxID=49181 RepID=UPI002616E770|nr:DUF302 domain-containing protein [Zoogloea sp.]MDD3355058.1 DUF302 domain-containing protein [Zoogloea sp.]
MHRPATFAVLLLLLLSPFDSGADGIRQLQIHPSRYADAREALVDAIETEGLVPSPPSRFGEMLARTGPALDQDAPVYDEAEVLHFCSARIAWQVAREAPWKIALCPLSVAIYTLPGEHKTVHLAWREAPATSPGGQAANALMARIAQAVSENAGRAGWNP